MAKDFPLDLSLLQRVLDYLNDAVYITDRDRCIVLWNRKAEEITGYPRDEVVGRRCRESLLNHVDKEGRPLCSTDLCPLYRSMQADSASRQPILVYAHTADRGLLPVSVSTAPLHDDQGNVIGGIEVFRDESESIMDLEFARSIQQHILTTDLPSFETLDIAARCYTLGLVGGDFYEVRKLAPETAGILAADVRGHGVSAALYTMVLGSTSENFRHLALNPADFMTAANRALSKLALAEVFATAVYMVVEGDAGIVRFANAGHPRPLLIVPGKAAATLEGGDLPLAFHEEASYEEHRAEFALGQTILLFTDGATEIEDRQGQMLGTDGLARIASEINWSQGEAALDALHDALLRYCASPRFPDDILLLSCHRVTP